MIAPTTMAINQMSELLIKCRNDPDYKADLIDNPSTVLAEMGIRVSQHIRLVVAETESMISIQRVAGDIVKIQLPSTVQAEPFRRR